MITKLSSLQQSSSELQQRAGVNCWSSKEFSCRRRPWALSIESRALSWGLRAQELLHLLHRVLNWASWTTIAESSRALCLGLRAQELLHRELCGASWTTKWLKIQTWEWAQESFQQQNDWMNECIINWMNA